DLGSDSIFFGNTDNGGTAPLNWAFLSGNVGIGNGSPGNLLDIQSANDPIMSIGQTTYTISPIAETPIAELRFYNQRANGDKFAAVRGTVFPGQYMPSLVLSTSPSFTTTPPDTFVLRESGYVGIGTTSPGAPLEVNGAALIDGPLTVANLTDSALTSGHCVQASSGGILTTTSGACGTSSGTVTVTGSPASGNLTEFSGGTSITNGNLSGDVTTGGTLSATVVKVNGASVPASATVLGSNGSSQLISQTGTIANNTSGSAGSVVHAATFNNSGSGAGSGTTFDGSAAQTISYNTLGAFPTTGGTITGATTISLSGTGNASVLYALEPSLATSNSVYAFMGAAPTTYNSTYIGFFNFGGTGSTANKALFGTGGTELAVDGGGNVDAPTFTADLKAGFTTSTSLINANTCTAATSVSLQKVTTTSVIMVTPTADTSGATGWGANGGLVLDIWPSTGLFYYK